MESSSRGEKRNRVDLEPLREQINFLKQQMEDLKLVHNKEKTEWEQEKKRMEEEKSKLQKEKEEQAIERAKLEGRMQGLEELVCRKDPLTDEELLNLVSLLGFRTAYPESLNLPMERKLLLEVLLSNFDMAYY